MPPSEIFICPHCNGRFPVDATLAGHLARKTLARYPGTPGGGKAIAALVIAIVTIGIGVLGMFGLFAAITG